MIERGRGQGERRNKCVQGFYSNKIKNLLKIFFTSPAEELLTVRALLPLPTQVYPFTVNYRKILIIIWLRN